MSNELTPKRPNMAAAGEVTVLTANANANTTTLIVAHIQRYGLWQ